MVLEGVEVTQEGRMSGQNKDGERQGDDADGGKAWESV
jgi:hypothetical protein